MPKKSRSDAIREFYRRAAEARRMANRATDRPAKGISSQLNNAGCPWPAAMRPKRSLRDPSTNSEVVAETRTLGASDRRDRC